MLNLKTTDWEINDIDTILFDKDGTFLNFHIYWGKLVELRVQKLLEYFNIDNKFYNDMCYEMGYDRKCKKLTYGGPVGVLSREGVINETIKNLRKYNVDTSFSEIDNIFNIVHEAFLPDIKSYCSVIEGADIFIKKLKNKGVKLAVVTSDTHNNTTEILKLLNLDDCFDVVIGKDDCKPEKKTGEPAKLALKMLNSVSESTIAIGDGSMDFYMAKNAKLKDSILVATGQTPFEELLGYNSKVVKSLKEVRVD